jgi:PAS domain S-box-containing protein
MTETLEEYKEYVNKRLSPISDILANIASGDFSKKLDIPPADDEFTELYVGLDFLMEDLEEHLKEREEAEKELKRYQHVLEDKVKERTAELSKINKTLRKEIQEHQKDKKILEDTEEKYRLLYENMSDVVFIFNSDLILSDITPSVERMSGYKAEELLGSSFDDLDFLTPKSLETAFMAAERLFQGEKIGYQEYEFKTKNGNTLFAEVSNTPIFEDGNLKEFICVARDITERKKAEKQILMANERLEYLLSSTNAVIYTSKASEDYGATFISKNIETLMGYAPQNFIKIPNFWLDNIHPEDKGIIDKALDTLYEKGNHEYEYRFKHKNGNYIWVRDEMKLVRDSRGEPLEIVGYWTDITERRHYQDTIKESMELYQTLVETTPEAVIATDLDGNIIFVSSHTLELYGYDDKDKLLGKNSFEFIDKEDHEIALTNLKKTLSGESLRSVEYNLIRQDGSRFIGELSAALIKDAQGNPNSFIATVRDITERKETEGQIKSALKEKEILLREVHHRVKNNIQVINSMLNLHTKYISDAKYTEMLKEIQYRVRSMALIHEKLYKSKDISVINFRDYIKELVNELFRSYGANISKIRPNIEVGEVTLDLDTGIPCGLIINELVSNSLKHGFPEGGPGEIFIRLSSNENNEINLIIEDTGIGISENFDINNPNTFGLQLVNTLVAQLRGDLEFRAGKGNGTNFSIKFTAPESKSEVDNHD